MVFSSYVFLFVFLPVFLVLYYGLEFVGRRFFSRSLPAARTLLLLCASYIFFGWERYAFLSLLVGSSLLDLFCGAGMGRFDDARRRKALLYLSLFANLGLLAFFKYRNLIVASLGGFLETLGLSGLPLILPDMALPMGISFFTFQSLSYTIDVYNREVEPVKLKDGGHFLCFVALFPQLVAGPIVRFRDVSSQLVTRTMTTDKFARGTFLFMLGFSKKALLANPCSVLADSLFSSSAPGLLDSWCGMLAYSMQIYFDFSGYSDMAIGLGLMIGFVFLPNFDSPYKSTSMTEFWRRWHISLSTWLRDYLYLPLGGNRRGSKRTYINLGIVMLLGGLWHGAAWTFAIWGAWHGGLLALERAYGKRPLYAGLPRPFRVGLTFFLVSLGWVVFRAGSLAEAGHVFTSLFGFNGFGPFTLRGMYPVYWPMMTLVIAVGLAFFLQNSQSFARTITTRKALLASGLFALGVCQVLLQGFNPFIYFQF